MGGRLRGVLVLVVVGLVLPASAQAAFPGRNGKIAFVGSNGFQDGIATVNSDGSQRTQLTNNSSDLAPTWSPDGTRIAFMRQEAPPCRTSQCEGYDTWVMNADGSGATLAIPDAWSPTWSPAGDQIAFMARPPNRDWSLWVANPDGSGRMQIFAPPVDDLALPAWSPNGQEIAFQYQGPPELFCEFDDCTTFHPVRVGSTTPSGGGLRDVGYGMEPAWSPNGNRIAFFNFPDHATNEPSGLGVMNADGSGRQFLGSGGRPAWSPDGSKIVVSGLQVMNADGSGRTSVGDVGGLDPDWQPLPTPYARPKGATPLRVTLVPAYRFCASPNHTHGPPLAFGSCNPAAQESSELTVGTSDANGAAANMAGFVRYETLVGNPSTPADEADLALRVEITDVRVKGSLADYAGEVEAQAQTRMTDHEGAITATAGDVRFPLTTQCNPTADTTIGSTCSLNTTLDTLIPGAVVERARTILQLGQVRVVDGGPDGDTGTEPNTVFLRQGIFVP